jgi:hypothetical protein
MASPPHGSTADSPRTDQDSGIGFGPTTVANLPPPGKCGNRACCAPASVAGKSLPPSICGRPYARNLNSFRLGKPTAAFKAGPSTISCEASLPRLMGPRASGVFVGMLGKSDDGIAPPAARRSKRETLASLGSHQVNANHTESRMYEESRAFPSECRDTLNCETHARIRLIIYHRSAKCTTQVLTNVTQGHEIKYIFDQAKSLPLPSSGQSTLINCRSRDSNICAYRPRRRSNTKS